MPAVAMLHEKDPREAILDLTGDLEGVEVFGNDILVAIYKRPEKTKTGIILVDHTRGEDVHQGKVGLILKMGPTCFLDDDGHKFRDISVGDWIVFRPSDGWRVTLNTLRGNSSKENTIDARVVGDISVRARVTDPDLIY